MERIKELISTYKDFPKKGINFKDIFGIAQEPEAFKELVSKMSSSQIIKNSEVIVAIDARGFVFGSAIALLASKPMIVARKPNKLPGEVVGGEYNLEYGINSLFIQKKVLKRYKHFAIVDDLLATGGTASCVADILKSNNKNIEGLIVVVELEGFHGRSKFEHPIESMSCL